MRGEPRGQDSPTVRYLCDSCGHRGAANALTPDGVLCEMCSEPVLADPHAPDPTEPRDGA